MTPEEIFDYVEPLPARDAIRIAEVIHNNYAEVDSLQVSIMAEFLSGHYDTSRVDEWIDTNYVRWSTYRRRLRRELGLTGAAIDE